MQLCPAISRAPSVSSVIVLIRLKIIINSGGAVKQMRKQILLTSRQKKANFVHIHSSAPIVVEITKWTPTYVCSRGIDSIANGISRNIKKFMKTDQTQFI